MRLLGRPVSASAVSCSRPTLRRSGRFVLGHVAQHLSRTPVGPEPGERGSLRPGRGLSHRDEGVQVERAGAAVSDPAQGQGSR